MIYQRSREHRVRECNATLELHKVYHWMQELFRDDGDEQEFVEVVMAMIIAFDISTLEGTS